MCCYYMTLYTLEILNEMFNRIVLKENTIENILVRKLWVQGPGILFCTFIVGKEGQMFDTKGDVE